MAHNFGCRGQKPKPRRGVVQIRRFDLLIAMEQHQPAGSACKPWPLEVHTISGPSSRWMRRQAGIVVGILDQVLGSRPLPMKSHHHIDRRVHVGHEHAIGILWAIEQLILLSFPLWLGLFRVTHRDVPVSFRPFARLMAELALPVGMGPRRTRPTRRLHSCHQRRRLLRGHHKPAVVLLISLHSLQANRIPNPIPRNFSLRPWVRRGTRCPNVR